MGDCLFCKIIAKQIPADFVFESKDVVAFKDIDPAADIHILIVPKEHVGSFTDLMEDHAKLLIEVYNVAGKLVKDFKLEKNLYRVVVNGGKAQKVPHLHFHFIGGKWYKRI